MFEWLWKVKEKTSPTASSSNGSISGLDPAQLALCADVSHWNGAIDVDLMDISLLFVKACDGHRMQAGSDADKSNYVDSTFHANVQKAWDKGIPCIPYIYVQWDGFPGVSNHGVALWHYQVFKQAIGSLIPGKSFHGIAIDVEERGNTAPNMAEIVLSLFKMLADDSAFAGLPIYIYSSISVLNEYANLREQISWKGANYNGLPYRLWMAQWCWRSTPRITTSWAELREKYLNTLIMKVITPGYASWNFVQVAANFVLPGCTVNITDLSFYKGSQAALYAELGYKAPIVEPDDPGEEPPPVDDVAALAAQLSALTVRVVALEAWKKKVQEG